MLEAYDGASIEKKWQERWDREGTYRFEAGSAKPAYTIDTPPPTVSGNMHIGHAFSYSQQDFIARYKRMAGLNVYYPFGTDDNGLPTERLVEKLRKVKSTRMERPDFVRLCRETIKEIKPDFVSDWKRIGMSCDFSTTYSTIDPHCVKTSQKSFLELHKKGLVYKKKAPSMWCVNCQTAIAQAELEDKELPSSFNDVSFKVKDGGDLVIATTRPELIPACVAIFVHPDDERYSKLVGKKVTVPLFNQEVAVHADSSADPQKGSGAMMICSYGDRYDVDAISRLRVQPRVCITHDGKMNDLAGKFAGLPIKEARQAIIKELDSHGLLKGRKEIVHAVNVHDKCGTEIEFLASEQWFVRVIEHKEQFLKAAEQIRWYPESMKARYDNWVKNLNWDWCISRQRHFGVPFPVWYSKKTGEPIIAGEDELPIDPVYQLPKRLPPGHAAEDIAPDRDIMDTWATSSMTPQIITNWIESKDKAPGIGFKTHYPTSLRPQAHDIIRTWAFYTIVKGVYHHGQVPWRDIIISGNVADPKGEKMSKSKGNVVDPRVVIEKYSADALRYWAATSKLGEDLAYQEKDLVTGKKTVTKLWNAARFCYQHLESYDPKLDVPLESLEVMDRWLLCELSRASAEAGRHFESYSFSEAKRVADQFFWRVFCDNYLEIAKSRLYSETDHAGRRSAQQALYVSFLGVLKMFAPIMPFVTEELHSEHYAGREGEASIHKSSWPSLAFSDEAALRAGRLALEVISQARKYKASEQLSLKEELSVVSVKAPALGLDKDDHDSLVSDVKSTVKARSIEFSESGSVEIGVSR